MANRSLNKSPRRITNCRLRSATSVFSPLDLPLGHRYTPTPLLGLRPYPLDVPGQGLGRVSQAVVDGIPFDPGCEVQELAGEHVGEAEVRPTLPVLDVQFAVRQRAGGIVGTVEQFGPRTVPGV